MNYICFAFLLLCVPIYSNEPQPALVIKKNKAQQSQSSTEEPTQDEQKQLIFAPVIITDYQTIKEQLEEDFCHKLPEQKVARKQYKQQKKIAKKNKPSLKKTNLTQKKEGFWHSVTISDMDYQQLLQRKNELIAAGDYTMAVKYVEQMFKRAKIPEQIIYIMLEWGELLMQIGDFIKAETLFRDFIKLYPSNKYAELAFVKAIECSWYQTTMHERDQTKTEETLTLIHDFCSRKAIYSQDNIDHVIDIQHKCHTKLAKSNLSITYQYINESKSKCAHHRIKEIKTVDLDRVPDIEPELLKLEILLAQLEKNNEEEIKKVSELKTKFPEHEVTLALDTSKKSWLSRVL